MVHVDSTYTAQDLTTVSGVMAWLTALGSERTQEEADLIQRAFKLAEDAHGGQERASGEPYINHALAVADILVGLRLDHETIAAAILHDVVEDTDISIQDIETSFGPSVAQLVNGVTKMQAIDAQMSKEVLKKDSAQAESLRKLLLAMAEDVRVVLIKLADRVHNMRTLKFLSSEQQYRISRETMDIYAPLANRLGIWHVKWELEDLSFRYLNPAAYKQIAASLDERRVDREQYIAGVIKSIETELSRIGIPAEVSGRPKHIYSIWRKMQSKGIGFHDVYDVRAIRIIVNKLHDCYATLGVVHSLWRHIPNEFDDYIATPKENMYQSIHTAVMGPMGKNLEIQIRTDEMHEHAELGVAAHWRYKEGSRHDARYEQKIKWLRQLLDWKDESSDAGDFIDRFKSEIFQDRVYVLTPHGDVMELQQGATPLDFAYYVHTEVGHRCRGAWVNGRMVPLTYELQSGDQVEVLTTRSGRPSRDWLNVQLGYLKTPRARAKARHWFKQQDYEINVAVGRTALEKELHRLGVRDLSHQSLVEHFHFEQADDFFAALGRGDISSAQIAGATHALLPPAKSKEELSIKPQVARRTKSEDDISIQGVGNLLTRMGRCCKPVLGDPIIGFITQGRGVTIHRCDCHSVLKMDETKRARLINVEWSTHTENTYPVDITVEAIDRYNLLRDIITILTNETINVTAVNTASDKRTNTALMHLTIEISNVAQLSRVLNRIGQLNNVMEVRRQIK